MVIGNVFSQSVPLLEKRVSIQAQNERIDLFLKRLSGEVGCVFSYSSSAIDVSKNFSGSFTNQSTREVLEGVFQGSVLYKERGVYLILTPAPVSEKEVTISGYVVNESTGERVRNATIYNPITLRSSTTDEFGFFEFQVKNPAEEDFQLIVKKENYADTLVFAKSKRSYFQNISLKIDPEKLLAWTKDSTGQTKDFWLWNKNSAGAKNIANMGDTIYRDFQLSLLPFLGTNRKLSGSVVNDWSVNVLGGYSGGTKKAEIGGLFNIDRGEVGKFQAAGLFNYNGGLVRGFQAAGLANVNLDSSKAFHAAGLANLVAGNLEGAQVAGVVNISTGSTTGAQVAGVANYTHQDVTGTQVSAVLNVGRKVTGSQIALLNYADSISDGVPVGLISFVRTGYHVVELSSNEVLPMSLALRTGTRPFYNLLFAGIRPESTGPTTWSFGYGIGTSPRLGKKLYLNIDFSSEQLNQGTVSALNLINRANLALEYQVARKVAVFAGPTINYRVYEADYLFHPDLFTGYFPKFLKERVQTDSQIGEQVWWGFKAGIRFF